MFLPSEDGQGLVRYAIILVVVALVLVVALAASRIQPTGVYRDLTAPLSGA